MEKVGYFQEISIKEVSIKHSIIKLYLIKASLDTKYTGTRVKPNKNKSVFAGAMFYTCAESLKLKVQRVKY